MREAGFFMMSRGRKLGKFFLYGSGWVNTMQNVLFASYLSKMSANCGDCFGVFTLLTEADEFECDKQILQNGGVFQLSGRQDTNNACYKFPVICQRSGLPQHWCCWD